MTESSPPRVSGEPDPEAPGRWGAFSYAGYRRFWIATVCRVFGLQFRFIGMGWLVVSSDGLDLSPLWLGIVGLASSLPMIVLAVPAGVVARAAEGGLKLGMAR